MMCSCAALHPAALPRGFRRWGPVLVGGVAWAGVWGVLGCTPHIIRSAPPSAPTSAIEMAAETDRLDVMLEVGMLQRDEIRKSQVLYARQVDQLRARAAEGAGLEQLALKRAELTLSFYDRLLPLVEQNPRTRAEETERSRRIYALMRDHLRTLTTLDQEVELLPTEARRLIEEGGGTLLVELMPPPQAGRLVQAYREEHFDRVTREVEGAGPDVLERMDPAGAAVYALSLGAQQRFDDAIRVAERINARELLPDELLQLRYVQVLWLLKRGRQDEATQLLQILAQESQQSARRLDGLRPVLASTLDELGKGSPKMQETMLDARLALAAGRYDQARGMAQALLEQEGSVEAINRIEAFLKQVDQLEGQAFRRAYEEVAARSKLEGGVTSAQDALLLLEKRFSSPAYRGRLETLRAQLAAVQKLEAARAEAGAGPVARPASPEGETPVASLERSPTLVGSSSTTEGTLPPSPVGGETTIYMEASSGTSSGTPTPTGNSLAGGPGEDAVAPGTSEPGAAPTGGGSPGAAPTGGGSPGAAPAEAGSPGAAPTGGGSPGAGSQAADALPSGATGSVSPAPPPDEAGQKKALEQARAQITVGEYEVAVLTLAPLVGTATDGEAASLRQKAIDLHVQRVRERVAREYVRAQQLTNKEERLGLLGSIYGTLQEALEAYPQTSLAAKAQHNLRVLEAEIKKLEPSYFERHPELRPAP